MMSPSHDPSSYIPRRRTPYCAYRWCRVQKRMGSSESEVSEIDGSGEEEKVQRQAGRFTL